MRTLQLTRIVGWLSCLVILIPVGIEPAEPSPMKRIMLLHQEGVTRPFRSKFDAAFVEALRSAEIGPIDLYEEAVETERFPGREQAQLARDYLKKKYAGRRIDVIVVVGDRALTFARENRDLFGNPPIVAVVSPAGRFDGKHNDTGLQGGLWISGTIDLAVALRPDTSSVVVVDGTHDNPGDVEAEVRRQLKERSAQIKLVYLRDLPISELVARVAAAPEHSVVLFVRQTMRSASENLDPLEGLSQVVGASPVPVFTQMEEFIGAGSVGGYVWRFETDAKRMAEMVNQVVTGASPRDIPVGRSTYAPLLDWRQLQRWQIPETRLPSGSVVLFRQQSFLELYQRYVIAGLVVFTAQLALIIGLLVQGVRRRRAEEESGRALEVNRDLTGRLIFSQEDERKRIARDLHDDACQEVAGIAVEVSNLLHRGDIRNATVQQALSAVQTRVAGVAESLRLLSHDLHPSVLEHIGLVAALETHCVEVERQYDMQVRLIAERDVEPGAPAIALSLFRITQEALRNAARHGNARHATVALARYDDCLKLSIADDGVGFDISNARQKRGLGLVSIEERARLVKGWVTIRSQPQQGTTIDVRVPSGGDDQRQESKRRARRREVLPRKL